MSDLECQDRECDSILRKKILRLEFICQSLGKEIYGDSRRTGKTEMGTL